MQVTPSGERPFPTPPTPNTPDLESARFANRDTVVLPDEMVVRILMYLGTTDIAVCRGVNRYWQALIDTRHLLARSFYRDCHLTQRINSLDIERNQAVERYHSHIRRWLADFGNGGRETAKQLDNILENKYFPEVLFFSIPKLLLNSNELTYRNTATIGHLGAVRDASFSPDGKYLATVSNDNAAKLWEIEGGQWREKVTIRHSADLINASFSPDGKFLAMSYDDRICKIWWLKDDQWQEKVTVQYSTSAINASFNLDGKYLVIASDAGSAKICWLEGGQWEEKFTIQHSGMVRSARFSPDVKHLLTVSVDRTVKIWKLDDGQWEEKFTIQNPGRVTNGRFSPDGKHFVLVTATSTGNFIHMIHETKLWALVDDQWREKATIRHFNTVNNVHFSPDGKHFVTASRDGFAKICGFEGGEWQVKATIWHYGSVANASFSYDGKLLMTASRDGNAKICGLVGGKWQEMVTIEHSRAVTNASFGPDYQLVTVSSDNTAKVWVLKEKESDDNSRTRHEPLEKHTIKKK